MNLHNMALCKIIHYDYGVPALVVDVNSED